MASLAEETVEHYEELRSKGLAGQKVSQNLGLALFLHRGMASWIKAWQNYSPSGKVSEKKDLSRTMTIAASTQNNLVTALVNMILSPRREILL